MSLNSVGSINGIQTNINNIVGHPLSETFSEIDNVNTTIKQEGGSEADKLTKQPTLENIYKAILKINTHKQYCWPTFNILHHSITPSASGSCGSMLFSLNDNETLIMFYYINSEFMKQGNRIDIRFTDSNNSVSQFNLPVMSIVTTTSPLMFPSGYLEYNDFSVVPDKTYTKFNNNVVSFLAFKLNNKIFKTFNTVHFNNNTNTYTVGNDIYGNDFMLTDPYMYPVGSIVEICAETIDIKGITETQNYKNMIGSPGSALSNSLAQFLGKIYTTKIETMATMEPYINGTFYWCSRQYGGLWALLSMESFSNENDPNHATVAVSYYRVIRIV